MEINKMIDLRQGDCLELMKDIPDKSIDLVLTDPPYGLSFMGKKWDYDVPSTEIWQEALRVLKPGGYLLAFAGTRTQHRMAVRIEDAGFEIRDMIAWIYGSGFPKSLNIGKAVDKIQGNEREVISEQQRKGRSAGILGKETDIVHIHDKGTSQWEGWGTALKPALEPITVARKPLDGTVANNVLKWGVGGINIDGCRVGTEIIPAQKSGKTSRAYQSEETTTAGGMCNESIGRFPANLIHDGSDEVVNLMPNDNARFFYCAKASKSERNRGCEELDEKITKVTNMYEMERTDGTVRQLAKKQNNHPTVKPIALMEYLVKLVSPENSIVLDPFMGSGTTGVACKNLNRNFIGMELDPDYFEIAKNRIENCNPNGDKR